MKRNVIQIDRDKCTGCGACAGACHQGAIAMVDGKAMLMDESHCDGLGMCLPNCPVDAIKLIEKEVEAFAPKEKPQAQASGCASGGCPSTVSKQMAPKNESETVGDVPSELRQWPCQIQLINPTAPYFDGADLLIAADCCSFSYGNFHKEFIKDKITIIGCPKLDAVDYSDKLSDIIKHNDLNSITVARMNVPCCGGLSHAVQTAIAKSGKDIVADVHIITTDGARQA